MKRTQVRTRYVRDEVTVGAEVPRQVAADFKAYAVKNGKTVRELLLGFIASCGIKVPAAAVKDRRRK